MIVAFALLGYAFLLATVGARCLARAAWTGRAPRLAVAAWQTLTTAVLVATVLGALVLAVPAVRISGDFAELLDACVMALRSHYGSPGGAAATAVGSAVALVVIGRCAWTFTAVAAATVRHRRNHRDTLAVLGRVDERRGITVLESPVPAAYCLPGRKQRVVLTTGALDALDERQLAAVLAHERAHLFGHHDVALGYAAALLRAFPGVRLFRVAEAETARLIELCADDAATAATERLTVAEALLALSRCPTPAAALGAGGTGTPARIRRLIDGPVPLRRRDRLAGGTGVAALLLLPLVIALGPAAASTGMHYCPVKTHVAVAGDCGPGGCAH
jgi:Zn-dependent protease with chaperone function